MCCRVVTSRAVGWLKQDFFASLKDLDMPPQAGLKQNRVVRLAEAHNSFYFRLELTNASI